MLRGVEYGLLKRRLVALTLDGLGDVGHCRDRGDMVGGWEQHVAGQHLGADGGGDGVGVDGLVALCIAQAGDGLEAAGGGAHGRAKHEEEEVDGGREVEGGLGVAHAGGAVGLCLGGGEIAGEGVLEIEGEPVPVDSIPEKSGPVEQVMAPAGVGPGPVGGVQQPTTAGVACPRSRVTPSRSRRSRQSSC